MEKIKFGSDEEAFGRLIEWGRVLRCSSCTIMEEVRPLMDPFWQRLICKKCLDSKDPKRMKQAEDRRLISTTNAKRNYFLDDEDMRPLRFISKRNPYHPNGPPVHYYSQVQCFGAGFCKQNAKAIGWLETKEMKKKRSIATKERIKKAKDNREKELKVALARDRIRIDRATTETAKYAKDFIRGGWKPYESRESGKRFWTVAEIVELYHRDNNPF